MTVVNSASYVAEKLAAKRAKNKEMAEREAGELVNRSTIRPLSEVIGSTGVVATSAFSMLPVRSSTSAASLGMGLNCPMPTTSPSLEAVTVSVNHPDIASGTSTGFHISLVEGPTVVKRRQIHLAMEATAEAVEELGSASSFVESGELSHQVGRAIVLPKHRRLYETAIRGGASVLDLGAALVALERENRAFVQESVVRVSSESRALRIELFALQEEKDALIIAGKESQERLFRALGDAASAKRRLAEFERNRATDLQAGILKYIGILQQDVVQAFEGFYLKENDVASKNRLWIWDCRAHEAEIEKDPLLCAGPVSIPATPSISLPPVSGGSVPSSTSA